MKNRFKSAFQNEKFCCTEWSGLNLVDENIARLIIFTAIE